jgi:transposase
MDKNNIPNHSRLMLHRKEALEYPIVVSCDAHTESTYVFAVNILTGEILMDRNVIGGTKECAKVLMSLKPRTDIIVLYEAGSLGFSLYRKLTEQGFACKIIASNSVPNRNGKKSDRLDAIGNLEYYCSGLLRFVSIPEPFIENVRECLRYRYNLVWERTALKQKAQALLKRQGVVFTGTKKSWTKKHLAWLKIVELPAEVRVVLDMLLTRISDHSDNIEKIDSQIMKVITSNSDLARKYNVYIAITGIGPLGAMTWLLEGYDLQRFAHPNNLMSYLGIIPRKNSSAGKDPALSITKAGNVYLRYITVVAARSYTNRRFLQSEADIKKNPEPLANLIHRCQERLCNRYLHFRKNKKNGNKAKVAIARELCGFIWELAVKILPQLNDQSLTVAA